MTEPERPPVRWVRGLVILAAVLAAGFIIFVGLVWLFVALMPTPN